MRSTITLDDDVAAEVARLRREEGIGISEAVNRLIRNGLARRVKRHVYKPRSTPLGLRIDVSDIGAVLDLLDEA